MKILDGRLVRAGAFVCLLAGLGVLSGCATTAGNIALGVTGTAGLSVTPNGGLQQTYYLGIFDPREQVREPQFYRIRVIGNSSVLSTTKFASGWVRAELVDSLSTIASFNAENGAVKWDDADPGHRSQLATGRRMILFGPEGFRPAPIDHRLVIVMGANPDKFFSAVDETLGIAARMAQGNHADPADREVLESLVVVRPQREQLTSLINDAKKDLSGE